MPEILWTIGLVVLYFVVGVSIVIFLDSAFKFSRGDETMVAFIVTLWPAALVIFFFMLAGVFIIEGMHDWDGREDDEWYE